MPILRLIDGEKPSLLSLHGVRQHKRLFLGEALADRTTTTMVSQT